MKDPRGWLILLAAAATLGALALRRGDNVKGGEGYRCLTHSDCGKGLRCYARPDEGPIATFGSCVEPCLDDAQCGPARKCAVTGKKNEQLLPVQPGLEPGERVCLR